MFRHAFVASLVLLGTACHGEDLVGPRRASGLTLTATVSALSFVAGQADTITITLANTTSGAITLHFATGCQVLPYITAADGSVVLPSGGGWMCTLALSQRFLASHEVQTIRFVWTGSTAFASEMPLRPLPPGVYYIYATVPASEAQLTTARVPVQLH